MDAIPKEENINNKSQLDFSLTNTLIQITKETTVCQLKQKEKAFHFHSDNQKRGISPNGTCMNQGPVLKESKE